MGSERLREEIFEKVREYYAFHHGSRDRDDAPPGASPIRYGGRVFDEEELVSLVDASLEFWLTHGRYADCFEKGLAEFLGVRRVLSVNSGSSANLLAFMALTSPVLGKKRINRGDEVITTAACFPTTVSPIVQYGAVPVFVDVTVGSYNIDIRALDDALTSKTKAVFLAHTMGNPFDVEKVKAFCERNDLWLIEDNCDALGALYSGKPTGTWGDFSTCSFYPAHHMTTGEGGAVFTDNERLHRILLSLRDWGRDCWCQSGRDNSCGNRFSGKFGSLPYGYDHKYVYSHLGYNLKITEMQAAIGCAQLKKLPGFIEKRKKNFHFLYKGLKPLSPWFYLPKIEKNSEPSWFGFPLTVRPGVSFSRNELVQYLEGRNIQTRNLFSGNILRHPCFSGLECGVDYRVVGGLEVSDMIMHNTFWIGLYPGMTDLQLEYMVECIEAFIRMRS